MIRQAAPSDVDAIARVHVKTWQTAYRGHMPDAHLDALDESRRAAMWAEALGQPAIGHTKTHEPWGFPLHETRYRRRIVT